MVDAVARWYSRLVIFVSDIERSLRFYVEQLGFTEAWRHVEDEQPLVAQLDRAGCELILSCQWPDKVGSSLSFISLHPNVQRPVRAEFEKRGVGVKHGWWGYKLMIVEDPDGNQLYFPYSKDEQA